MIDVVMPSPAEGVDEAVIARWLKSDGSSVAAGDDLLEIETDKVTIVQTADAAGILRIVVAEGTSVPAGTVIGRLAEEREAAVQLSPEPPLEPTAPAPAPALLERGAAPPEATTPAAGVRATPLARLIARREGVDIGAIAGTGPRGLVTRADVTGERPRQGPAENGRAADPAVVETLTRMQQVVARRMTEAKATIPEFQVQTEVTVDALLALRAQFKELGDVTVPSVNDFIIKATALALREHPRANGSYQDDRFLLHRSVNVGFAVAADDALVVPTIRDADRRPLVEIAGETRRLAERARTGTSSVDDLADGTFTVSNLGMYGITAMTPILNAPQAAILGVGAARTVADVDVEGRLIRRQLMTLTLTCDHRILYGADAARFLSLVRALLEQPLRLTLVG